MIKFFSLFRISNCFSIFLNKSCKFERSSSISWQFLKKKVSHTEKKTIKKVMKTHKSLNYCYIQKECYLKFLSLRFKVRYLPLRVFSYWGFLKQSFPQLIRSLLIALFLESSNNPFPELSYIYVCNRSNNKSVIFSELFLSLRLGLEI